jgi:23S rRNA pseudouridine2605 synthase
MNNKAIIKKGGARPTSSRPSSNKPKPAMQKRAQGPKVKINTKVAEVVSDKVEKNRIRHLRDLKLKTKFV